MGECTGQQQAALNTSRLDSFVEIFVGSLLFGIPHSDFFCFLMDVDDERFSLLKRRGLVRGIYVKIYERKSNEKPQHTRAQ